MTEQPDHDGGLLGAWLDIVARAWGDEEFKQRLKERPGEVLREYNVVGAPGVRFRVVENEADELVLVLPAPPAVIERVAGAGNVTVDQYYAACI
jgi:hypothetical protein